MTFHFHYAPVPFFFPYPLPPLPVSQYVHASIFLSVPSRALKVVQFMLLFEFCYRYLSGLKFQNGKRKKTEPPQLLHKLSLNYHRRLSLPQPPVDGVVLTARYFVTAKPESHVSGRIIILLYDAI